MPELRLLISYKMRSTRGDGCECFGCGDAVSEAKRKCSVECGLAYNDRQRRFVEDWVNAPQNPTAADPPALFAEGGDSDE